jgi:MFS transporter, DHA2 family, multidrug resistance protein
LACSDCDFAFCRCGRHRGRNFQAISGLASGTFIPLAIGFVVQNLPTQLVIYGVAAYSLNLELSLNIAASIEGWFDDHWSWQWIFWDTALLAPLTLVCIRFGMPRQPVNRELLKNADWAGMLYASVGFSLLYAGLDQGNRLDWLNSGLINALLLGGILLLVVFVVHELTYKRPWINLRFAASGNMPLLLLFISFFRFIILSTSYIIPQYLITVQNYRAIEIGGVIKWVALPQFLATPLVATILRFVDARVMMALGFALVGCACFLAGQLTHDWVGGDFLPSQFLQAIGQSLGLTSLVWFALQHLEPSEIFTYIDCLIGAHEDPIVGPAGMGIDELQTAMPTRFHSRKGPARQFRRKERSQCCKKATTHKKIPNVLTEFFTGDLSLLR